jgi:hypothetical protein
VTTDGEVFALDQARIHARPYYCIKNVPENVAIADRCPNQRSGDIDHDSVSQHQHHSFACRPWRAEQISLHFGATLGTKAVELFLCFDPFRRRRDAKTGSKAGNRADDCPAIRPFRELAHE